MDEITETNSATEDNKSSSNNENQHEKPDNNPYAYLDRNEFTSEKFKIEVRGLPKYYGLKELKKLLNNKLQLKSTKIKVPSQRSSWIYICFRTEEDKLNAIKALNNYEWKNNTLQAEEAKPVPDPLVQKRIQNSNENEPNSKKVKLSESEVSEKVKDATTPLWRLPYVQQIENKVQSISTILRKLGNNLGQNNAGLSNWWYRQRNKYSGLCCELLDIRHANSLNGYRNKCEFTIGINEDNGEKTIGFRLSSYVKGSVSVGPIDDTLNVPLKMKLAVTAFQNFVRNSELDVFNPEHHTGYWKQVTARFGFKTDQLMLIIGLNPQQMTTSELEEQKNKIKIYFTEGEGKPCNVTSLYFQQIKKKRSQNDEPTYEHICGDTHITEQLLGKTFRISPQAFFQVNTNAAEILYESIGELAGLTQEVTLLDVCCGTGTIGICLADKCGEVLGLEISPEAIADAEVNASSNNVANAKFFAGKAEDILSCVAHKSTKGEIIAVVDPPRAGLQHDALVQLRKTEHIKKLVYVSCDPKAAVKNFIDLGRATSKIYKGEPFLPVKAIPVDLFPHTPHCELLIYFERNSGTLPTDKETFLKVSEVTIAQNFNALFSVMQSHVKDCMEEVASVWEYGKGIQRFPMRRHNGNIARE